MTKQELIAMVPGMTDEQAAAILEKSRPAPKALTIKVSEKGGLSVYGLGRFPVTLYKSQWERLLGAVDEIKATLSDPANVGKFTTRD